VKLISKDGRFAAVVNSRKGKIIVKNGFVSFTKGNISGAEKVRPDILENYFNVPEKVASW
jgi:hypothetical protein